MGDENNTPLNEDPMHGGVTDAELQSYLDTRFATNGTDEPTVDDGGDGSTEPPSGEATPLGSPDGDLEGVWEYDLEDGQKLRITRDQARTFAEFEAFLAANPDLAEAIGGAVVGTHKFLPVETPAPQATTPPSSPQGVAPLEPPDALDLDDPVQRAVWERLVATNEQLQQATEIIGRHEAQLQRQQAETTGSLLAKATDLYRDAHKELTDEDMGEITTVVARLNVLPAMLSPVDPVTNLPRQVDPIKALNDAYDLAYWQIPRLRDAQLRAFQAEEQQSQQRKNKLSSLGGSSGSVPRQPTTVPSDPQERRKAMLSEMSSMLNGNWINPEDS